jgi:D-xylose 1-dehydrogenase (NADP+, D-xylono-1,5-lactone-forming)
VVRSLRWGLLGVARINRSIIPALRASPRSELVAVASRDPARAAAYAREWGIPRTFGRYEDMLVDGEIDVVYNPLPNSLHAEWTIRAARAGKHVLCEKPLAISVEEVDAIAKAARAARVVVAEGLMYRHQKLTREVRAMVERGTLGELRVVRGCFTFPMTREGDVRLDPALGGGCLWDLGVYPISYARMMIGSEPSEAFGWQTLGPTGVDVAFAGQLHFQANVVLQCDTGFGAAFRRDMEIVGSEASLFIPNPFKPGPSEPVHLVRGDERQTIDIAGSDAHLYLGEVEDLADAVLLGRPPAVSLADSGGTVAAIVALLASAREARPVRVG